ncbi:terpene synthase [Kitasatospora sp. NPDC057512]|uniref:terpene synthase family protein n=1 Tax=Kitasatospora sp. NPDC057512 TaxID=3346154 RepID=UPI0036CE1068
MLVRPSRPAGSPGGPHAFFMPFAQRTSPHLERVRAEVRAWAERTGLFEDAYTSRWPRQWSRETYEKADFPLWVAMTHPDAGPDELTLTAAWHVALWFVDDLFLPLCRDAADRDAVLHRIDRLLRFLPVEGPPALIDPVPRNPVERAFADLWPRTAPTMSPAWRRRFASDVERFLRGSLGELDRLDRGGEGAGVDDPIEYVHARREFGGLPVTATLMEHGLGEIPGQVHRLQPFQSALRAFADVISLHNDIVSYHREVGEGGVGNNGVEVLRRSLTRDHDLADAFALMNRLLTCRVRTLETTVLPELDQAMADEGIGEPLASRTRSYVQALMTATAGSYAWHEATGRFDRPPLPAFPQGPTGPGTSAARWRASPEPSAARGGAVR